MDGEPRIIETLIIPHYQQPPVLERTPYVTSSQTFSVSSPCSHSLSIYLSIYLSCFHSQRRAYEENLNELYMMAVHEGEKKQQEEEESDGENWRLCQKVIELRNLPWNWQRISCHFSFTLEQWTQRLTTLALFISVPSSDHSCNFRFCYFVLRFSMRHQLRTA